MQEIITEIETELKQTEKRQNTAQLNKSLDFWRHLI